MQSNVTTQEAPELALESEAMQSLCCTKETGSEVANHRVKITCVETSLPVSEKGKEWLELLEDVIGEP